jgi:arginyl-tRNA synthetase
MVSYLYTLSRAVSSQYYHLRIKGEPFNVQRDRWAVLEKAKWILENGIELFGLTALSNI